MHPYQTEDLARSLINDRLREAADARRVASARAARAATQPDRAPSSHRWAALLRGPATVTAVIRRSARAA